MDNIDKVNSLVNEIVNLIEKMRTEIYTQHSKIHELEIFKENILKDDSYLILVDAISSKATGKRARIRNGAVIGMDMNFHTWPLKNSDPNKLFSVFMTDNVGDSIRYRLIAYGYGWPCGAGGYGSGSIFVDEKDLLYVCDMENENEKCKS